MKLYRNAGPFFDIAPQHDPEAPRMILQKGHLRALADGKALAYPAEGTDGLVSHYLVYQSPEVCQDLVTVEEMGYLFVVTCTLDYDDSIVRPERGYSLKMIRRADDDSVVAREQWSYLWKQNYTSIAATLDREWFPNAIKENLPELAKES